MSQRSKIQWTDRVWNPVRGCSVVSPGCARCYAMRQAHRFSGPGQPYEGLTKLVGRRPVWAGDVRLVPEVLDAPLRWRRPSRVFVNSMSDLFHEQVPFEFIERVYLVMQQAYWHTFQVLTKRPQRVLDFWKWVGWGDHGAPNVWLGVSAEDQRRADERIPLLLQCPAAVRWVSAEPLLNWVGIRRWTPGVDWVVVGGESGPGARPMALDWARSLVEQCAAAGVPAFVKQLGAGWAKHGDPTWMRGRGSAHSKGGEPADWPPELRVREYPEVQR